MRGLWIDRLILRFARSVTMPSGMVTLYFPADRDSFVRPVADR
ncbi:MAG: hypothetical protein QOF68_2164 [Gaiellales bacterium]|nr:hypothetical protein [Gaiellales bacterium]